MIGRRAFLLALAAMGCGQPRAEDRTEGGAKDDTNFGRVMPGRKLQFPADHGAHPEFRHEWW